MMRQSDVVPLPLLVLGAFVALAQSGAGAENVATGTVRQVPCRRLAASVQASADKYTADKAADGLPATHWAAANKPPVVDPPSSTDRSGSAASGWCRFRPVASTATFAGPRSPSPTAARFPARCPIDGRSRPWSSRGGKSLGFG